MKTLHLTWFHLKRVLFNNWGFVLFTLGFPLVIIFFFLITMQSDSSAMTNQNIAIVNHSDYVEEQVVPHLSENFQEDFFDDAVEAFEQLDQLEVTMLYEIPEGFPFNDEQINIYSLSGENRDALFESELFSRLTESRMNEAFSEANLSFESVEVAEAEWVRPTETINGHTAFVLYMILFFMGYATGFIAGDLAKMRQEGLLTRSIISNTYSWQILGSVLFAYVLYEFLASTIVISIMSAVFNLPINHPALLVSLILSMSIFIVGLTMVLFRLFKNEALIQMIGLLLAIVLAFIPLIAESFTSLQFVQFLSPYYWIFEAIDTGQIFPNVPVVILYGLVLFTSGSFKIERLVKV